METWFRLPKTVRVVIYAAVGFAFAFLACLAWDFDRLYNVYNATSRMKGWLVVAVFPALLVPSFLIGIEDALRRTFGSFEQYVAYTRALRTGELPAIIEPGVWRVRLSSSRLSNRMEPLWASLFVVFGVLFILTSQSAYWVTASLFGLLAIQKLVSWWRMRARITWLAAEVERHAPRGSII